MNLRRPGPLSSLFLLSVLLLSDFAIANPLYRVGNRLRQDGGNDPYLSRIQPILSSRCVACHGCYEAPCQMNLESYEGLRRGFHPSPIFAGIRLGNSKPTRLIDAKSIAEWRAMGFFSVVNSTGAQPEVEGQTHQDSILYQLLEQGSRHNGAGFDLKKISELNQKYADAAPVCVATDNQWNQSLRTREQNPWNVAALGHFLAKNPQAGMPFGLTKIDNEKERTLFDWLEAGAKGPEQAAAEQLQAPANPQVIAAWENFLNGSSNKEKHTGRYIYEHVYTAHLHIDENPGEFFEVVRSRTRTGSIDQIVTELPYDAPGVSNVYYRFKKITRSIAQKTHFVWRLNHARLAHLKDLFLNAPDWPADVPAPQYGSANPFFFFAPIPARVRSKFLMENSRIIVGGMTQGSVCVGSTATYAIRDHFWTWFLRPEIDPSVTNPNLGLASVDVLQTAPQPWEAKNASERLAVSRLDRLTGADLDIAKKIIAAYQKITGNKIEAETMETIEDMVVRLRQSGLDGQQLMSAMHHYFRSSRDNKAYQQAYEKELRLLLKSKNRNHLTGHDLWRGEDDSSYPLGNPNAWLNITRHGRSATVQYGADGGSPQSIWVMSYSNFERLYYNLVASYKEWGTVLHKMATWRHMSYVRLEGEDLAISFLPLEYRKEVRARFTQGIGMLKNVAGFPQWSTVGMSNGRHYNPLYHTPLYSWDLPPRPSPYRWKDADSSISYLVGMMRGMLDTVSSKSSNAGFSPARLAFEKALEEIAGRDEVKHGQKLAQYLPSISYLRVEAPEGPWVYSLIVDRGYKAHNIMIAEDRNRDPRHDTLTFYRGLVGHYPNTFFTVTADKLPLFLQELRALVSIDMGKGFQQRWGIARNSSAFWPFFDWLHEFKTQPSPGVDPVEQGIVDLSQYDLF